MGEEFVIGMDGGGTATNVIIAKTNGIVIKSFRLGALNINGQSREATEDTLKAGLQELQKLNLKAEDCKGVCVGAAGISNADTTTVITQILRENGITGRIKIVGDHETALAGALEETWGVILIAGTGSICFGITQNGESYRAGGYGHIIDDAGSGYSIGKAMLRAIVRAADGRGEHTVLTEKVFRKLGIGGERELVTWIYNPDRKKKEIAALAVLLEEGVKEGDKVSNTILQNCVSELAELARAVLIRMGEVKSLVAGGSVLIKNHEIYRRFCEAVRVEYPDLHIVKMEGNAAEGAVKIILKECSA